MSDIEAYWVVRIYRSKGVCNYAGEPYTAAELSRLELLITAAKHLRMGIEDYERKAPGFTDHPTVKP